MPAGPGKYDDLTTYVREQSEASCVLVMILDGVQGSGFSVQVREDTSVNLPGLLRRMADDIEATAPQPPHDPLDIPDPPPQPASQSPGSEEELN